MLNQEEESAILQILGDFTSNWQAHGHDLAALGEVIHHQFIILSVDEQVSGATGCSIDKSVALMKDIEQKFNINLFDRFRVAFKLNAELKSCSREDFEKMIENGEVNEDTLVFNNLIQTRKELKTSWEIPLKDSWHARVFSV
jgi:predicted HTH domain antitoxin